MDFEKIQQIFWSSSRYLAPVLKFMGVCVGAYGASREDVQEGTIALGAGLYALGETLHRMEHSRLERSLNDNVEGTRIALGRTMRYSG